MSDYRQIETGDVPNRPEIHPLKKLEDYQNLSANDINARYMRVIDHQLSTATYFSNKVKNPSTYLSTELENYATVYGDEEGEDAKDTKIREVKLARQIHRFEPLVSTGIKRLVSFTVTPGSYENVEEPEFAQILTYWLKNVTALDELPQFAKGMPGIQVVLGRFVRRLLIDGDLITSENWEKVKVPLVSDTGTIKYKRVSLPTRLDIHDVLSIDIPELPALYGREIIKIRVPESLVELLKKESKTPSEKLVVEQLDPEIVRQIKGGSETVNLFPGEKKIPSLTSHIKLDDDDFIRFGRSFLLPSFEPVAKKHRIRALDEATITGMINRLTIIKAGIIDTGNNNVTITPERLMALEDLISKPKTNELIIWPGDDISVLDIGADGKVFEYTNRYEHVDRDILAALGIPRILIDGYSETRTDNAYVSFSGLREFLTQDIRNMRLVPFMERIGRAIAEENKYKAEYPTFKFSRMNLHDPEMLLAYSKFYYDRGMTSQKTTLADGGFEFETEKDRRDFESENGIVEEHGIPILPFNSDPSKNPGSPPTKEETLTEEDTDDVAASVKTNKELAIASLKDDIRTLYETHTQRILNRVEKDNISKSAILGALIVLFGNLKSISSKHVEDMYKDSLEKDISQDPETLEKTIFWVEESYDSWYDSLSEKIDELDNGLDLEVKLAAFTVIFSSALAQRIHKYEVSFSKKAEIAAKVTSSIARGKTWGTWETSFVNSCPYCEAMHGKSMPIGEIAERIPVHPACNCSYIEHTSKPKNADTNIPKKDPNNWSKISS